MQNHGMIYGYARVSTDAYDLGRQLTLLTVAGRVTTFCEKKSGVTAGPATTRASFLWRYSVAESTSIE